MKKLVLTPVNNSLHLSYSQVMTVNKNITYGLQIEVYKLNTK